MRQYARTIRFENDVSDFSEHVQWIRRQSVAYDGEAFWKRFRTYQLMDDKAANTTLRKLVDNYGLSYLFMVPSAHGVAPQGFFEKKLFTDFKKTKNVKGYAEIWSGMTKSRKWKGKRERKEGKGSLLETRSY